MTAVQLRSELFQEFSLFMDSEAAMRQLLAVMREIRKTLASQKDIDKEKKSVEKKWSKRVQWLRTNPVKLTEEVLADEKTQYILSFSRRRETKS